MAKAKTATGVLPNNLEAEQALLGCLLIDNDTQTDVLDKLSQDDFYQESHKLIIGAMKKVFNARKPVDLVTLADQLEADKELEKAGGISYITDLAKITPSAANFKYYLDIVKRDSIHRRLIRASQKIIDESMSGSEAADSIAFAERYRYPAWADALRSLRAEWQSHAGASDGKCAGLTGTALPTHPQIKECR